MHETDEGSEDLSGSFRETPHPAFHATFSLKGRRKQRWGKTHSFRNPLNRHPGEGRDPASDKFEFRKRGPGLRRGDGLGCRGGLIRE